MTRSTRRTLSAALIAALSVSLAGCSLIPGLGGEQAPPPPTPSASATGTPSATSTANATTTPAGSKTSSGTSVPVPGVPKARTRISSDIDGIELRQLVDDGALLVDLRPAEDFKKEHIEGARNVPMPKFGGTAIGWSRSRAVIVYDRTGAQGQSAQTWLVRNGFTEVYHLFGGLEGYDDELVGTDPTPIPPKEPVLYYFYADGPLNVQGSWTRDNGAIEQANQFAEALDEEFDGRFVYRKYDLNTVEGLARFLEFDGIAAPMFRLVDQHGNYEQFTGTGTLEQVRSRLKRAIEAYEEKTGGAS